MNKTHYALILVLLGGALLIGSFFGQANTPTAQATPDEQSNHAPMLGAGMGTSPQEGDTLSLDFQLKDMDDVLRNINEWQGKLLVLNFWATWCGPCRHEIPVFNAIQKKYAQQNVQFIGLAYDDKAAISRFTSIIPVDYPILYGDDEVMDLSVAYGNVQSILPFTVFIDNTGKLFHIAEGALTQAATESILAKAL